MKLKMKKYENKNLGITLVALVITIVILLILAGISISTLTNTGIFEKTKEAKQLIKQQNFTGKSLYIAVASKKRTDRKDIHLNKVDYLLSDILSQVEDLRLFHKSFPEENHGTVAIPAIYDGIKQLFEK